MSRPIHEVADIFRRYGPSFLDKHSGSVTRQQRRVMKAVVSCRTAALGGHTEQCDRCGHQTTSYNSCRNRHCTKCQALAKAKWLEARKAELLPVPYFHVVFTVPACIGAIALQNKRVVYDILFRAAAETLRRIGADPQHLGAEVGLLAVLHTWGQNLHHHPHVHCVVPGGGPSLDGSRWVAARENFFLPVRVLSRFYRGVFLRDLCRAYGDGQLQFAGSLESLVTPEGFANCMTQASHTDWVVYCKPPFGGPEQVLDYLGRYTHRIAISNHRLLDIDGGQVRFQWKDYSRGSKSGVMTLQSDEFIRRFLLHVLPPGFVRLRYFGFMANRHRKEKFELCRKLLSAPPPPRQMLKEMDWRNRYLLLTGYPIDTCPACGEGRMIPVEPVPSPPTVQDPPRMDSS